MFLRNQNIRTSLKVCLCFLFACFFNTYILSQPISEGQLKAGFVYSFLKYVDWQNENKIDTFKVAILGEDNDFVDLLKKMSYLHVKNKPIKVTVIASIENIPSTNILVITNDKNYFVKEVFDQVVGKNILLITDRYDFQRYVMINFIYGENSKVQFEINSKNIEDSHLQTSPKLVLLGGTEIDVRKLYLETEKSLITEKVKSESFEKELKQKQEVIQEINAKLVSLNKEIKELQNKIFNQKDELNQLSLQTDTQQKKLDEKNLALRYQQYEIIKKEKLLNAEKKELSEKQAQILEYSQVLKHQENEINKRQTIIEDQGKTLLHQIGTIKVQRQYLLLLISLVLIILALAFVAFRNYMIKKQKNLELEKMNLELNNKNSEIQYQASQLELKNIELEKLSIVAKETVNAIMIMNEKGEFEWVNEGFTRIYGDNLEKFISKRGQNLIQASNFEHIEEVVKVIFTDKKPVSYESPFEEPDGKIIWVHTTLTPILDTERNIKKLIAIDSDITDLKEAEFAITHKNDEIQRQSEELIHQASDLRMLNQELQSEKNKLEIALEKLKNTQKQLVESEKMVILGQLTAGIAHEINNPMNFINSGIDGLKMAFEQVMELLKKYENLTTTKIDQQLKHLQNFRSEINYTELIKDIEQMMKDIKSGVHRTTEIIRSLRTFSRLDESDLKFVDLHKSIDSTLLILRNKYIKNIEIVRDFGNIPEIECYPGKINQVLLNIIVNAIQAIPGEGEIFIKTSPYLKDGIEYAIISIRDTGMGMTDEVKNKLFEPFFATKVDGEGTGLGLSISESIIDNHHGYIEVESSYEKGSTFNIYLPVLFQKKLKTLKSAI